MLELALLIPLLAQSLPEGPGKELVEVICTACHDTNRIVAKQGTKAEWQSRVLEMLQECPDVAQDERDKIVNYLAKSFPKHVNVNTASAKEIEAALELSAKEAEAIVTFRQDNGKFHAVQDLKKVAAVDSAKLDAVKDRIEY
ncbi:MAG: helix-hairpin-helix domain-containing protein [Bryobacterales bacterium]|nr:helix-hairpin-helix domain-containing protein [Bryobacterales bacterium]MBV9398145.1 helix-hairpin-helix domain-containing protein [Bryobacterales bacterium]